MKKVILYVLAAIIVLLLIIVPIGLAEERDRPLVTLIVIAVMICIPLFLAVLFPYKLPETLQYSPPKDFRGKEFMTVRPSLIYIPPSSPEAARQEFIKELADRELPFSLKHRMIINFLSSPNPGAFRICFDVIYYLGWFKALIVSVLMLLSPLLTAAGLLSIKVTFVCAGLGYGLLIAVIATRKLR